MKDGDPCCPYPDNWADVTFWLGGALVVTAGLLALGYLDAHAIRFAAVGRAPEVRQQRRLVWAAALLACTLLALAAAWVVAAA